MCGFPPPLKDVLYLAVNTLCEHTHMLGWQRDRCCGVRGNFTIDLCAELAVTSGDACFLDEETGPETAAATRAAADSGTA